MHGFCLTLPARLSSGHGLARKFDPEILFLRFVYIVSVRQKTRPTRSVGLHVRSNRLSNATFRLWYEKRMNQ